MEDVTATRDIRQGLGLSGPQSPGEIGDGGVGSEAPFAQFQQAYAPSIGVAVLFRTEQVAVGRGDIGADQHRPAGLEDLVVGAEADGSEVLPSGDGACSGDGLVQDVVNGADRQRIVKDIREQFGDAAQGTVADEGETQDELPQPGLGDREPEEELVGFVAARVKGVVEGVVGLPELLVDELAADLLLGGQFGDGLAAQRVEGELLARLGWQQPCGCGGGERANGGRAG